MAKKIFFGNYKGGVGKTTSVFQIGINLAQKHNKKVLLLDLDPQASLSRICTRLTNTRLENIVVEKTLNYLLELYTLSPIFEGSRITERFPSLTVATL